MFVICGKPIWTNWRTQKLILNSHLITSREEIGEENFEKLTINNPVYYNNEKLGFSNRRVSPTIKLYEENEFGELKIPRNAPVVYQEHEIIDERTKGHKISVKSKIDLRDDQKPAVDAVMQAGDGILQAGTGKGKGHDLSTPLLTPKGFVELGNLNVGDYVIGSNGKPTKITKIYERGTIPTYKVKFSDGAEILCDGEHLFNVTNTKRKGKTFTKQVNELKEDLTYSDGRSKWFIPLVEPVEFESNEVPIDPYVLGVLIGDGKMTVGHNPIITNPEQDIINKIKEKYTLSKHRTIHYTLLDNPFWQKTLKELNLLGTRSYERFIPKEYMYNSIEVRLEILRGLFDTDGYIDTENNSTIYYSTSKELAKNVVEIVRSLGGIAKTRVKKDPHYKNSLGEKVYCRDCYVVSINLGTFLPFHSEKHKSKFKERKWYKPRRYLKEIEYVGEKEIRCISVEAEDSLYVAKDYIVTHNTIMAIETIARFGRTTIVLVHKEFLMDQFKGHLMNMLGLSEDEIGIARGNPNSWTWKGRKVVLGMLQSIHAHKDNLPEGFLEYFGYVIVDECHRTSASTFAGVITLFPCWKRLGLTATPKRSDGLEIVFHFHLGGILYQLMGVNMKPSVHIVRTQLIEKDLGNINSRGNVNMSKLITKIAENEERNKKILKLLFNASKAGRKIIVLSDRRAQSEWLKLSFDMNKEALGLKHIETRMYVGGMPKDERQEAEQNGDVLFATFQMAKEGLDIPMLDTLFLVTPNSSEITIEQSLGRIARSAEGKKDPMVVDFLDSGISICNALFNKRMRVYNKMELEVK